MVHNNNRRIEELENLEPGWLDGDGEVPSSQSLAIAEDIFDFLCEFNIGVKMFPTPTGGVSIEVMHDGLNIDIMVHDKKLIEVFMTITGEDDYIWEYYLKSRLGALQNRIKHFIDRR